MVSAKKERAQRQNKYMNNKDAAKVDMYYENNKSPIKLSQNEYYEQNKDAKKNE